MLKSLKTSMSPGPVKMSQRLNLQVDPLFVCLFVLSCISFLPLVSQHQRKIQQRQHGGGDEERQHGGGRAPRGQRGEAAAKRLSNDPRPPLGDAPRLRCSSAVLTCAHPHPPPPNCHPKSSTAAWTCQREEVADEMYPTAAPVFSLSGLRLALKLHRNPPPFSLRVASWRRNGARWRDSVCAPPTPLSEKPKTLSRLSSSFNVSLPYC